MKMSLPSYKTSWTLITLSNYMLLNYVPASQYTEKGQAAHRLKLCCHIFLLTNKMCRQGNHSSRYPKENDVNFGVNFKTYLKKKHREKSKQGSSVKKPVLGKTHIGFWGGEKREVIVGKCKTGSKADTKVIPWAYNMHPGSMSFTLYPLKCTCFLFSSQVRDPVTDTLAKLKNPVAFSLSSTKSLLMNVNWHVLKIASALHSKTARRQHCAAPTWVSAQNSLTQM